MCGGFAGNWLEKNKKTSSYCMSELVFVAYRLDNCVAMAISWKQYVSVHKDSFSSFFCSYP